MVIQTYTAKKRLPSIEAVLFNEAVLRNRHPGLPRLILKVGKHHP